MSGVEAVIGLVSQRSTAFRLRETFMPRFLRVLVGLASVLPEDDVKVVVPAAVDEAAARLKRSGSLTART